MVQAKLMASDSFSDLLDPRFVQRYRAPNRLDDMKYDDFGMVNFCQIRRNAESQVRRFPSRLQGKV